MKENLQGCLIVIVAVFLATLMIYSLTGCAARPPVMGDEPDIAIPISCNYVFLAKCQVNAKGETDE